ncbi:GGDEF domain-containing protein [Terrihabitans rhizophilus]|uniref:diguanylate cyclase n=1 Tax=Terrihabitans rhizophilus TaxID=3092662 RepID=A0ABU4RLK9_9HYPH|nr:GGDEF domain-containing protein [Terrihabitans sp. PJ23]MDX6805702.1 GGDEF domain-containing protein [Terrihabitans sp. PJ23]
MPNTLRGPRVATSLKARVFLLMLATLIIVAIPAAGAFVWIVNETVTKIGTLFAEKQILFDRYRGLESLMREVSLAETVARSPAVVDWAQDEADPAKAARGIAELEHYRLSFADRSYFAVLGSSGNYYFNDAANSFAGQQNRYRVQPDNPRDGWYYTTVAHGSGCHLNVDHDDTLAVTKVWTNCVIRSGDKVLGVIGTGVDLSHFIREVVDIPQKGVQSMFVDSSGAVQAHRDPKLVDFHSLTKDLDAKKTVYRLIDSEGDRAAMAEMIREVTRGEVTVQSRFMTLSGHDYLVGVAYLDKLGWYNVTLMDVDEIVDREMFLPIGLLLAGMLLAAALLTMLLFKRSVLDRLGRVEEGMQDAQRGVYDTAHLDRGRDEIGRLSQAFGRMARSVGDNTTMLEQMVLERTGELERIAYLDPLTEIPNRRGFVDSFVRDMVQARRAVRPSGLMLVDMDHFKSVNDTFGHQFGDEVLVEVVNRVTCAIRRDDICARWGGDEFIILLKDCDESSLARVGAKIVAAVNSRTMMAPDAVSPVDLSVSIGACMIEPTDSLVDATAKADAALYAAKLAGRDCHIVYGDPSAIVDLTQLQLAVGAS